MMLLIVYLYLLEPFSVLILHLCVELAITPARVSGHDNSSDLVAQHLPTMKNMDHTKCMLI